jgi:hypothetical protein
VTRCPLCKSEAAEIDCGLFDPSGNRTSLSRLMDMASPLPSPDWGRDAKASFVKFLGALL